MSAIIAATGFLTAAVVLIVERTASKHAEREARREGYVLGYRDATTFQQPKVTNQEN